MFALIDSDWGIILIVVAVLVLFGGSKLPKLFHSLGSAQAEYKRGLAEGQAADPSVGTAAPAAAVPPAVAPPQAPAVAPQAPAATPAAAPPNGHVAPGAAAVQPPTTADPGPAAGA
jgi:sec-independent protein translocase protein TatA